MQLNLATVGFVLFIAICTANGALPDVKAQDKAAPNSTVASTVVPAASEVAGKKDHHKDGYPKPDYHGAEGPYDKPGYKQHHDYPDYHSHGDEPRHEYRGGPGPYDNDGPPSRDYHPDKGHYHHHHADYPKSGTPSCPGAKCSCPSGVANCGVCPEGYFTTAAATTTGAVCQACPAGKTTSSLGATSCDVCLPGYAGASCGACPKGSWSEGGLAAANTTVCTECSEGLTTLAAATAAGSTNPGACIPSICSASSLRPVNLPAGGGVTQWELPQCGEVTLPTGAGLCAFINADGTYQGPFINYYIAPSDTDRTLYTSTCALAQDGWEVGAETTDTAIYLFTVDPFAENCTFTALADIYGAICNDDFEDSISSSSQQLELCTSYHDSLSATTFELPANTPAVVTVLVGWSPESISCEGTEQKLVLPLTIVDITNYNVFQTTTTVVRSSTSTAAHPRHSFLRHHHAPHTNKSPAKKFSPSKPHHAQAELASASPAYISTPADTSCACPAGVGCGLCPLGSAASGVLPICSACPQGSCAVCAAGYGNVGGVCTECPAGTYSEGGPVANTTCLTCDDGRSSLKGASSCVVGACALRNITSVDLDAGGSYGLWQAGKCTYIPESEVGDCLRFDDQPMWAPLVEFMIEPVDKLRTIAVTSCRMSLDPFIEDTFPDTVVQVLEVTPATVNTTCTATELGCNDYKGDTNPEFPGEAFTCTDIYQSYTEVDIPAGTRVIVRTTAYNLLSCVNTNSVFPVSIDVFDITPTTRRTGVKPKPTKPPRKTPEQKRLEREAKKAQEAEGKAKRKELKAKNKGKQGQQKTDRPVASDKPANGTMPVV